jgi:hypothetical protein
MSNKLTPNEDRSKPLAIILSEQQWLAIGMLLAREIRDPESPEGVNSSIREAALKIQQTINRLYLKERPGEDIVVTNLAGEQQVNEEYLFGDLIRNIIT